LVITVTLQVVHTETRNFTRTELLSNPDCTTKRGHCDLLHGSKSPAI